MRKLTGVVVSDKMDKAVVVKVETAKRHPIYKKGFTRSSRVGVSDPSNELKVGDVVEIVETRPVSKSIHFKVQTVLGRAEDVVKQLSEQEEMRRSQEEAGKEREETRKAREEERAARDETAKVEEKVETETLEKEGAEQ